MLVGTQKTLQCPIITTIDSQGEAILTFYCTSWTWPPYNAICNVGPTYLSSTTEVIKSFLSALEMYEMYGMNKLSSPAITL